MKMKLNKKYVTIALYCAAVILFAIICVFFFKEHHDFGGLFDTIISAINPMVYGVIIAYLLWPLTRLIENKVFAFITGDDKVPVIPKKPTIPEVPKAPKEPKKPTTDPSSPKYADAMAAYRKEMAQYKKDLREYKIALSNRKYAERKCASIEKNTPRLEKKIERVNARHEKIKSRSYDDGVKRTRFGLRRTLSVLLTVIIAICIITLFLLILIPQVGEGINELIDRAPMYAKSVVAWLTEKSITSEYFSDIFEMLSEFVSDLFTKIADIIQEALPAILNIIKDTAIVIKDVFIGIFFAIYFLLGKERVLAKIKKLTCAIFPQNAYHRIAKLGTDLNRNFGAYIKGKLLDSFLVGVITFFGLWILKVPYYPLVAVVVGVTDVIPMFGPFIGTIPCALIIFITDPGKALVFVAFILVLQQFDGNIMAPKLLGEHVNTTSLSILTALTVLSAFWGIVGLLMAVPLFVVAYELIKESAEKKLAERGLPTDTADFYNSGDEIGIALHDEDAAKDDHKKTIKDSLKTSAIGKSFLRFHSISSLVDKMDESTEEQNEEKNAVPELVFEANANACEADEKGDGSSPEKTDEN